MSVIKWLSNVYTGYLSNTVEIIVKMLQNSKHEITLGIPFKHSEVRLYITALW